MTCKFRKSIKRFQCSGVEMIGDIESGIVIGLSAEGAELADCIMQANSFNPQKLTSSQCELLNEMETSGFFSEECNTLSCVAAYFHVTSKCNLNCIGCYSYEENRNMTTDMSLSDVKTVVKNIKKAGASHLIISGGEPMLRADMPEILFFAKRECNFAKITLISNGTVPKERYDSVLEFVDEISISIEGYDESSSFIRNGSIDEVLGTIRYLSRKHASVNMIVTLHKRNLSHVEDYIRLSQNLKVPFTFSILTIPQGTKCNGCELDESDYLQIGKTIEEVPLPLLDTPFTNSLGCKDSCGLGKTVVSVASDGKIFPCHMLQDNAFCLGNALEEDIIECINRNDSWSVEHIIECNDCELKYLCGGGCYARRVFYSNSIDSSHDPCCEMYKSGIMSTLNRIIQAE